MLLKLAVGVIVDVSDPEIAHVARSRPRLIAATEKLIGCAIERLSRQGLSRPQRLKAAPLLPLRPQARRVRRHQARTQAALRHRGGDRTHEERRASRPLLAQRQSRRRRQRDPLRGRLQSAARPRLAEGFLAPDPERAHPGAQAPISAQIGLLTTDSEMTATNTVPMIVSIGMPHPSHAHGASFRVLSLNGA
jgi:hypothetical protein